MTTTMQNAPFVEYTDQLREMANVLQAVVIEKSSVNIDVLLKRAADIYGTTASQMKYALSFAGVKKLVTIDYDSATVSAVE